MTDLFKNAFAVASWLARPEVEGGGGYKVGKSKVYADIKARLLLPGPDGAFGLEDVKKYARAVGLAKAGPSATEKKAAAEDDRERQLKLQAERITAEQIARIKTMDADKRAGLLMPRPEFEAEVAARALVLDAGLRRLVREQVPDWVFMVAGDPKRARDLMDRINDELDSLMNEYASLETFQVMLAPGEAEETVEPGKGGEE